MNRSSAIIMPLFSLPSPYGIGTMGAAAYDFIDFLKEAGQTYWQLLPLGPTDAGDSPYSSPSTFAGNPYYIDLDMLVKDKLLTGSEVGKIDWGSDIERVDYGKLYENRFAVLRKAYAKAADYELQSREEFCSSNARWLDNYALYMALKGRFGNKAWMEWPEEIRMRNQEAISAYASELSDEIGFWKFLQYLFFKQWNMLRSYAVEKGIKFIGDVPIYVALDSADVWSEPWFFRLDERNVPTEVSGVPPDYFNKDGQLWNNPLYDYDRMRADGYGWWIRRIEGATRLYDVLRIDHFRGFEDYWAVPYGETTAINGHWEKGPGMSLVGVLSGWFSNIEFIAEDLGELSDGVRRLLGDSGFPGMKVLEFAFDSKSESSYLPHHCTYHSCCYVGTHDNDTVLGWLDTLNADDRKFASEYMHITEDEGWCYGLIRTGMSTASDLFGVQMQDVLELPGSCRTNIPGIAEGNWRWRMKPGAAGKKTAERLCEMTKTFRRYRG